MNARIKQSKLRRRGDNVSTLRAPMVILCGAQQRYVSLKHSGKENGKSETKTRKEEARTCTKTLWR